MARIKLLELNSEGNITPTEEAQMMEPFASMLSLNYNKQPGDTQGRERKRAKNEFRYIYFMYDWNTPLENLEPDERHIEALLSAGLPKNYKFSDELTEACRKFKKLRYSRPVKQLLTARQSLDRIRKFLDTVDPNEQVEYTDNNGDVKSKPKYDTREALDISKMIQDHVKNLPDLIKKMNDLEAQVMKDESEETTARGEHSIGRLG